MTRISRKSSPTTSKKSARRSVLLTRLLKRFFISIFVLIFLTALALETIYLCRNAILALVLPQVLERIFNTEVRVKSVSLSLTEQSLLAENVTVYSPAGFSDEIMAHLPRIYIEYDFESFFTNERIYTALRVNLERMIIVTNPKREKNIEKAILSLRTFKSEHTRTPQAPDTPKRTFRIRELTLSVGEIITKDCRAFGHCAEKIYPVYDSRTYQNLTNIRRLSALIVVDAIKMANIKGILNEGVTALSGVALGPVKKAGKVLGVDPITDSLDNSISSLTNTLFLPFDLTSRAFGGSRVHATVAADLITAYQKSVDLLKQHGTMANNSKPNQTLNGNMQGVMLQIQFQDLPDHTTRLSILAQQGLYAKPHVARSFIYYLSQELDKEKSVSRMFDSRQEDKNYGH